MLIRALENFKPNSNNSCDLYAAGEVILNHLKCATQSENLNQGFFKVFPNPVNSNLILQLDQEAVKELLVFIIDINGKRSMIKK